MSTDKKVAVVTGQIEDLGVPVIRDLLAEGCRVFLLSFHQPQTMYARGLEPNEDLHFVQGSSRESESWWFMEKEVMYHAAMNNENLAKVDLLINISGVGKPSTPGTYTIYDLEYAMSNTVHPIFLALPIMRNLLEQAEQSQVLNIYPGAPDQDSDLMSDLGDVIARASADALTRQTVKSLVGTPISMDSLCYPVSGISESCLLRTIKQLRNHGSDFNGVWKVAKEGKTTAVVLQEEYS